ncbi:DUF5050 domain-containing protein [Clostridium cylindrosporum]|nr:DUF5050 domain-containing protein [Clostridium cylindrosporum]
MPDYIRKYEPLWGAWGIDDLIGEGSFGKVYKLTREEFGHKYEAALKLIRVPSRELYKEAVDSIGNNENSLTEYFEEAVREIVKEIEVLYTLKGNNNIVGYEEHMIVPLDGEIGWDILIKMEFVKSLKNYTCENRMSRRDIIKLGIDICSALELCNSKGIIHRDIKEENIFISQDGKFKLGDFGIAKKLSEKGYTVSKKGTPIYMAPEVYKDERYTFSVDIYSLGLVLYKLLNNGRLPFMPPYPEEVKYQDSQRALNRRLKGDAIEAPVNAGDRLAKCILKACAYNEEDRYLSPSEMKLDLDNVMNTMLEQDKDEKVTFLQSVPSRSIGKQNKESTILKPISNVSEGVDDKTQKQPPSFETLSYENNDKTYKDVSKTEKMVIEETERFSNLSDSIEKTERMNSIDSQTVKEDEKDSKYIKENEEDLERPKCIQDDEDDIEDCESEEIPVTKPKVTYIKKKSKKKLSIKNILIGAFIIGIIIPFCFGVITGIVQEIKGIDKTKSIQTNNDLTADTSTIENEDNKNSNNIDDNSSFISKIKNKIKGDNSTDIENQWETGNSSANILNGGIVAKQGDYIYYSNQTSGGVLCRAKIDGSEAIQLSADNSMDINVVGEWIYYTNANDGYLYKIKADGSGRTRIGEGFASFVNVVGDSIYYINPQNINIYKMKTDGSNSTSLSSDLTEGYSIDGGMIYYIKMEGDQKRLYRMDLNGNDKVKISEDYARGVNVSGEFVYYINQGDNNRIYKVKKDGSSRQSVSDIRALEINVVGNKIYYINSDDYKVYEVNSDGSGNRMVSSTGEASALNIAGDVAYFRGGNQNPILYKMNIN